MHAGFAEGLFLITWTSRGWLTHAEQTGAAWFGLFNQSIQPIKSRSFVACSAKDFFEAQLSLLLPR